MVRWVGGEESVSMTLPSRTRNSFLPRQRHTRSTAGCGDRPASGKSDRGLPRLARRGIVASATARRQDDRWGGAIEIHGGVRIRKRLQCREGEAAARRRPCLRPRAEARPTASACISDSCSTDQGRFLWRRRQHRGAPRLGAPGRSPRRSRFSPAAATANALPAATALTCAICDRSSSKGKHMAVALGRADVGRLLGRGPSSPAPSIASLEVKLTREVGERTIAFPRRNCALARRDRPATSG